MRILMVIDSYLPAIGGAQRHVRDLSFELAARGHEISIATLWNNGLPEFEVDHGVHVYRVRGTVHRFLNFFSNPGRSYAPPFPDPELSLALRKVAAKEKPMIVHAHNWLLYSFLPIKSWGKAKVIVTLHGFDLVCPTIMYMHQNHPCTGPEIVKCLLCSAKHFGVAKGLPTAIAKRIVGPMERKGVDMFLPVSQFIAEGNGLARRGLPFKIIPNFVLNDVSIIEDDISEYVAKLPRESFLLFVGSLTRFKGVQVLLEAYSRLVNVPPLVLIGSVWPDTPKQLPDRVVMLHDWPYKAVLAAWNRSLIGIVPSILPEACPTVVLEAMASGRPVIAARSGGILEEVVNGETGFLVTPGDPIELSEAIKCLLNNPELMKQMGYAGKKKVIEFQADTIVPLIEKVYQEALHHES